MAAAFWSRAARPLAGAVGIAPLVGWYHQPAACDDKPKAQFQNATCLKSEQHTHDTKKITLQLGADWTQKGAVVNVQVRAGGAVAESGCCACCKCPPPCGCPKGANGCCACCKCPGTCGCPKQAVPAEKGCCACCTCPQPCGCPKQSNGCCACCKCPDTCGCPKKEAPKSSSVTRVYNPLSVGSGSEITLLVKKYADSKMGTKLHSLKEGETVEVKGPNQQWTFKQGKYKHYGMVAGGTGITPLMQATNYVLKNDTATVTFTTFNKTPGDVLLRKELDALAKSYPGRLNVVHFVEGGEEDPGCTKAGRCCMKRHLKALMPAPADDVLVMVCGRPDMTGSVAGPKTPDFKQGEVGGFLKDLGYESKSVWKL